ncbi:hypothetical protein DID88_002893 [Monilinia fructigena]|uniref:Uncharacterized protein n=1 Tax=Monilinia fructigena TaxID=38457 RepID=A0A395INH0_9HELO|nr:hypothetical protein DID88_002893 [Monilinia fructigena]
MPPSSTLNSPRSTSAFYHLHSPAPNIHINTNSQQNSFFGPLAPNARHEVSYATNNTGVTESGASVLHNKGGRNLVHDSSMGSTEPSNTHHSKGKEADTSFARHTSSISSEHSSGSEAALYCSVGSRPSEEDVASPFLSLVNKAEVGLASIPIDGTLPVPGVAAYDVVGGDGERERKNSVTKRSLEGLGKLGMRFKRLFSRKNSGARGGTRTRWMVDCIY